MKSAIAWFARNPVAANLLMWMLLVGGVVSIPVIQQKTFPDIDINMIQIGVPYLGAAPEEVEEGVCIRVEEELDRASTNVTPSFAKRSKRGVCIAGPQ